MVAYKTWLCIFLIYYEHPNWLYGDSFKGNDIIDVLLDLKNDDGLSFAKNNKNFGKTFFKIDKLNKKISFINWF